MNFISNIFLGVKFYNSVINEYIQERQSGKSRLECNLSQIKKRITGNQRYPLSDEAVALISLFDVIDTVQFLMYFNDRIYPSISTIPIKRSAITRLELLRTMKREQFTFLDSIPDLRNNTLDIFNEYELLTQILSMNLGLHLVR